MSQAFLAFLAILLGASSLRAQGPLHELTSPNAELEGYFGSAVDGVPDLNGDGVSDLVVGAWRESGGTGLNDAGVVYVFSGADGTLLYTLVSPNAELEGRFGFSVAGVRDVDGDGRGDLFVGAQWEDPDPDLEEAGRAYLFSGATGVLLRTFISPRAARSGAFGTSVEEVPDVDGDGREDFFVGAVRETGGSFQGGRAYVFSGASGALLLELQSPYQGEGFAGFGGRVAGVEDLDSDGRGDLLIGAPTEDLVPGIGFVGRAYVFSGATGALLHDLRSPNEQEYSYFGADVDSVPDIDGDGREDLLVAAIGESPGTSPNYAGRAYVFSGASGKLLYTLASPAEQEYGSFGKAVAGVPDLDGDGHGDLVIGAADSPDGSPLFAGRVYVFSGATGVFLHGLQSPDEHAYGYFGDGVAELADVDGDGVPDLFVGAPGETPPGSPFFAGRTYVFSGGNGSELTASIAPVSPPVVIPPGGGSFSYIVTLTNTSTSPQVFDAWLMATLPDGSPYGPVRGPRVVELSAGGSVTRTLRASVPAHAPAGTYTLTANAGTFPDDLLASDSFTLTKEGMADVAKDEATLDEAPILLEFGELVRASPTTAVVTGEDSASGALSVESVPVVSLSVHPNPAAETAAVTLGVPRPSEVTAAIYDLLGKRVLLLHSGALPRGTHTFSFHESGLSAGIYVIRAVVGETVVARRITLLR